MLRHPLLLHGAAPNRWDVPRLMRSQRIGRATEARGA
jgi:hypothetical protein